MAEYVLCFLRWTLLMFGGWSVVISSPVFAEEGGSGHYLPGYMASSIDLSLSNEAVLVRLIANSFEGTSGNSKLPMAGQIVTEADIETDEVALDFRWSPADEFADGWVFNAGVTFPYISMRVSADIVDETGGQDTVSRRVVSEQSGLGDVVIQPLMFAHTINREWWGDYRLALYAPTGDYELGRLANTGKNYWTISPSLGFVHIEPAIGREFSVFGGIEFNSSNSDADYLTGTQAHIESTFVQNIILLGGFTGIGVSGYWYQQLTGDSGQGAVLGEMKSQAIGIGPVLSYRAKWHRTKLAAELKWLHDIEVSGRFEGDTISIKVRAEY
ncbi:SphA family protein [Photobacterium proteolyticum]|nr:transporter [Photobacterium proteolyticum]